MYGKIFESMYDGTLSADWKALVTFQQLIVLADPDGQVDFTPPALSRRTGIPLEIIEHGLKKLAEPDPYSRSADEEGRRIVLLDSHRPWGWQIVNHAQYRDIASARDRRVKARQRKRQQREREREREADEGPPKSNAQAVDYEDVSHDVTPRHTRSRMSRHTDADTDTNLSLARASRLRDEMRLAPEDYEPPDAIRQQVADETGLDADRIRLATLAFRLHRFSGPQWNWDDAWRRWIYRETAYGGPRLSGGDKPGKFDRLFGGDHGGH